MRLLRLIGWLLILVALGFLAREGIVWLDGGSWTIQSADSLWADLNSNSLAAVQRAASDVAPWVRQGFDTAMGWPVWAVIGGIGLLMVALIRRRKRNGRAKRYFKS